MMPPPSQPLALSKRADIDGARPVDAPLTNREGERSAKTTRAVLAQFDVVNNPRYAPNQPYIGTTWCNIFVWDATRALGCEIPHWLEVAKTPPGVLSPWNGPGKQPDGPGGEPAWRETNANAVARWLAVMSARGEAGWREASFDPLNDALVRGLPAIATWENPIPANPGHAAMVLLSQAISGHLAIVQAGAHNYFDAPLSRGFGSITPRFYVHE